MKKRGLIISILFIITAFFIAAGPLKAQEFKLVIMQDKKGAASKYYPLLEYLKKNGVEASFVAARNYGHAADLFAGGNVNGMFSGSGIAGTMMIKGLAYPLIRPVHKDGWSTYWAVVLAPKGAPRFTQDATYFNDKKVIFCSLASSGEFYYRSLSAGKVPQATLLKSSSHGAAVDALARGRADVAIVKNRVWDGLKDKHNNLVRVGEDPGENPNGTLIVPINSDPEIAGRVVAILLALGNDASAQANAVKESLKVTHYVRTGTNDFKYTIDLLSKAGVDKAFPFHFN